MRVKLCARCPYVPQDMAGHYDPCATLHLCTRRDDAVAIPAIYQRREVQRFEPATDRGGKRRERCAINTDILSVVLQTKAAASVEGSLA
jgi:hypothetical protein